MFYASIFSASKTRRRAKLLQENMFFSSILHSRIPSCSKFYVFFHVPCLNAPLWNNHKAIIMALLVNVIDFHFFFLSLLGSSIWFCGPSWALNSTEHGRRQRNGEGEKMRWWLYEVHFASAHAHDLYRVVFGATNVIPEANWIWMIVRRGFSNSSSIREINGNFIKKKTNRLKLLTFNNN